MILLKQTTEKWAEPPLEGGNDSPAGRITLARSKSKPQINAIVPAHGGPEESAPLMEYREHSRTIREAFTVFSSGLRVVDGDQGWLSRCS